MLTVPKKELEKLQSARAKLQKLKDQLAGYENILAENTEKLKMVDGKIRDIIADGGNPTSVTTEKSRLSRELEADGTTVEFYEKAIADAEAELKEITAKLNHILGEAIFSEQQRRQDELQKMVSQIENGLLEYRKIVYESAAALGLAGPLILPAIKLRADYLLDALR